MKVKTCTKCRTKHPATPGYFPPHKHTKDKLQSWCRICCGKIQQEYRQTEKGKAVQRRGRKKYYSTINGHLRNIYADMKRRCNNPKHKQYKNYGGRGIKCLFMSDEFVDYVIDVLKVDPRGLQTDRIDNNGNYEKGNIRFVTCKENCNNRVKRY